MDERYIPMNNGGGVGIFDTLTLSWTVYPYYTWDQAKRMAKTLNRDPRISIDDVILMAEAA